MLSRLPLLALTPLLWIFAIGTGLASAQPAPRDLSSAGRVVHQFDFEERDDGNFEDLPMHWSRVVGPGMPHYVKGSLTTDAARSGQYSFRLDLNGGSALYRLGDHVLPAQPSCRYRVDGFVRTSDLKFARSRLTAYCLDASGRVLPGSIRHSDLIKTAGDWQPISVETFSDDPNTAWLVLEVGLLQPAMLTQNAIADDATTSEQIARHRQDVDGSAWFDDLTVSHVPEVRLGTAKPGQVFSAGEAVVVSATAFDPKPQELRARLLVRDRSGRLVADVLGNNQPILPEMPEPDPHDPVLDGDAPAALNPEPTGATFDFDLNALPSGWYEATVVVGASMRSLHPDSVEATARSVNLVILGDDDIAPAADDRIAVDATHLSVDQWQALPSLLPTLAAGRVQLSMWSRTNDAAENDAGGNRPLDRLASALNPQHIKVTGVIAGPTPRLEEAAGAMGLSRGPIGQYTGWPTLTPTLSKLAQGEPLAAGGEQEFADQWRTALSFMVSRHARQVDRWQIGLDKQASLFASDVSMRQTYHAFKDAAESLMNEPDIAMPWPVRAGLATPVGGQSTGPLDPWEAATTVKSTVPAGQRMPGSLTLRIPADVQPSQIPLYVDEVIRHPQAGHLSLSLELLNEEQYDLASRRSDLARRLTWALASGVDRVTLPLPFHDVKVPGSIDSSAAQEPDQLYLPMRTMTQHLAGKRFRGRLPAPEGVRAFLFAPDNSVYEMNRTSALTDGIIVLWTERTPGTVDLPVSIAPGGTARQYNLSGRVRDVQALPGEEEQIRVLVGTEPTIITGVETGLTRLRQLVRFDNAFVESRFEPQTRTLQFENPYDRPISGRIGLKSPDGWRMELRGDPTFVLQPGQLLEREVEIQFPYNSFSGSVTSQVELRLAVGGSGDIGSGGRVMRVPLAMELGLAEVGLNSLAWRDGNDIVVEQTISNYSDDALSLTCFVAMQGVMREEKMVLDLPAGRTTTKTYRLLGASGRMPKETTLRSGVRELEGHRILNQPIEVADSRE